MKLNDISELIRKHAWLIVTAVLIVILLVLAIVSLSPKNPRNPKQSLPRPDFESQNSQTLKMETKNIALPQNAPKSLPVYGTNYNQDLVETAPQMAQKLGLNNPAIDVNDSSSGKGILYTNDNNDALIVYPNNLTYQRVINSTGDNNFGNLEALKKDALSTFSSLGLKTNFSPPTQTTYYSANDDFVSETTDPNQASLLKITFYYQIENTEVYNPKNSVSATFNKSGQLTNLAYYNLPLGIPTNPYQLLSAQQALEELQSGKSTLVALTPSNNYTIPPPTITNADINTAQLAYFFTPSTETIQPIWIFKGQGGENLNLTFAIPAIESQFFTQP